MKKKLSVAFLWHMHQPLYKNFLTGVYELPWVRLHATYSYLDMAVILHEFPDIRCTFNITPTLMYQLLDIAENSPADIFYDLSRKDAAALSDNEKCFILKNFFSCSFTAAIFPMAKYKELYFKRGDKHDDLSLKAKLREFSPQDFCDMQVFFNLAWCGFILRERDGLVQDLVRKAGNYTEEEKNKLLDCQDAVVRSILPIYKKLQQDGKIEVSTTPYYHPILPLLCKKKGKQGFDFTDDAKWQVKEAVELYKKVFGRKPFGMWPAEGAVSQDVIPIFADNGIKWIATDEGILLESFKDDPTHRDDLVFSAFNAKEGSKKVAMVFREVNLSNAIGFKYSGMPGDEAAKELFKDIVGIKEAVIKKKGDHILSIILDGENPWPYYPDGGKLFLREIYRMLSESESIETSTIGEYVKTHTKKDVSKLISGSWINRDFSKWIGSSQKNKAWALLKKTREDLLKTKKVPKEAMHEIYIAEGSDWYWWYDDFGTELNYVFDDIFRMHLSNVYKMIGKNVPEHLKLPLYPPTSVFGKDIPGPMIPPVINGKIDDEMEWIGAHTMRTRELAAVMVRTDAVIEEISYGYDKNNLYVMIRSFQGKTSGDTEVDLSIASPMRVSCDMPFNRNARGKITVWDVNGKTQKENDFINFASGEVMEISIPFNQIGAVANDEINFRINIKKNGLQVESWPAGGFFKLIAPDCDRK